MSSWWLYNLWTDDPALAVSWVFWVIFSICIHELAHGYVAIKCGDPTPLDTGHMTWNPMVHMGGLSLLVFLATGFTWGMMPVDPSRFRGKYDDAKVAFAGPLSNFILFISMSVAAALWIVLATSVQEPARKNIETFLTVGAAFNCGIGLLNLLPIPPLDGSKILGNFIPSLRRLYSSDKGPLVSLIILVLFMLTVGKYFCLVTLGIGHLTVLLLAEALRLVVPGAAPAP